MVTPDLTPFGFTATESRLYATLLHLGSATGYAVAQAARLARANAYGALDGLVARGGATKTPGRPARYRPADPASLLARLAAQQGEAIERLSRALQDVGRPAEPETRSLEGTRALANLVLQVVARAERRVEGVVAADLFRATLPAWRRAAERTTLELRIAGSLPPEAATFAATTVSESSPTLLLVDERQTVAAIGGDAERLGIWSSHPAVAAIARAALSGLA
jgi:sugar-specific transcriptional regulator TrmB